MRFKWGFLVLMAAIWFAYTTRPQPIATAAPAPVAVTKATDEPDLATVLGSDTFCHLNYDEVAKNALLAANHGAMLVAVAHALGNSLMSPAHMAERCAKVERSAKSFGLLK
jgi:hypothetical protein